MIVPIPIEAFFLALMGDLAHGMTSDSFWYRFSLTGIGRRKASGQGVSR